MLALVACSSSPSQECQEACARQAECAENLTDPNYKFNQDECTRVCTALRRDKRKGRQIVDRHIACLEDADGCDEVMACSRDTEVREPPPGPAK